MPKIRLRFDTIKFQSRKKTEEQIDRIVERGMQLGAREFVIEAANNVPVVTGMARGSLRPLAEYVKVSIPIEGTPQIGYLPDGRQVLKGPELGARQAQKPPYISKVGSRYVFEFQNKVFHYWLNDLTAMNYKKGQKPTPWKSFERGMFKFQRRFDTYIKNNLSKVLKSVIRFSGGRRNAPVNLKESE